MGSSHYHPQACHPWQAVRASQSNALRHAAHDRLSPVPARPRLAKQCFASGFARPARTPAPVASWAPSCSSASPRGAGITRNSAERSTPRAASGTCPPSASPHPRRRTVRRTRDPPVPPLLASFRDGSSVLVASCRWALPLTTPRAGVRASPSSPRKAVLCAGLRPTGWQALRLAVELGVWWRPADGLFRLPPPGLASVASRC